MSKFARDLGAFVTVFALAGYLGARFLNRYSR